LEVVVNTHTLFNAHSAAHDLHQVEMEPSGTTVEFGRGAWHCKLSADTKIRVVRTKRIGTSLVLAGVGITLMVVGFAFGVEPGLIFSGGMLALLGADSCRRVEPVYLIRLENGADASEVMMPNAVGAEALVADLSAEVERLRSIAHKPSLSETAQYLVARAG
jgi:hypothetical protein